MAVGSDQLAQQYHEVGFLAVGSQGPGWPITCKIFSPETYLSYLLKVPQSPRTALQAGDHMS